MAFPYDPMMIQMWFTVAIIMVAIVMFAIDRIPLEVSAIGAVCALMLFFHFMPIADADGKNLLDPESLLRGFANPVLFTIMALLIIGQGLFQTSAIDRPARLIARLGRKGAVTALSLTLATAGLVSGFLNNTPVVVIFVPIMAAVAASIGLPIARVMMPLSFISILGGMTTLIGSSSNLIVAALAEDGGLAPVGFFDFSVIGFVLAAIGALYVIFVLPRLLPHRDGTNESDSPGGQQFIAEITITEDHPWIGVQAVTGMFPDLPNMTVRMIRRGANNMMRPFEDIVLRQGDVLSVASTRRVLTDVLASPVPAMPIQDSEDQVTYRDTASGADEEVLVPGREPASIAEATVPPGSRLVGLNLEQAQRRVSRKLHLVGIKRHRRMARRQLESIRMEPGDVLLVLTAPDDLAELRDERSLLLLAGSVADVPTAHHANTAIFIFAAVIGTAATGFLPISVAAVTGALAMMVGGCINARQLYRAIDRRVFLLIGAAFALALALQVTGGAEVLAGNVVRAFAGYGAPVLLSVLFLLTAVLTNFLSNQATAALMTPVTISTAIQAGFPPEPFVYGLIFALNCSFATPIAYQTNLIVMGPGNYTFGDFIKGGLPLIVLIWLAYSLIAPMYFGL
ncbi:MAG: SLC13 family permease [Hyphomicrobiaceae bacterium]